MKNKKLIIDIVFTFFLCVLSCYVCEKNSKATTTQKAIKPYINKNTQIVIDYGCRRPKQWGTAKRTITIKNKKITCKMNTRDYVLYLNSIEEPVIEIEKEYCKLKSGKWKVKDLQNKTIIIEDKKKIHIDHILPFKYIRLNMNDCKKASKYYNYLQNLTPEYAEVNETKSDFLCETKEECEKQKSICKAMSTEFNDKTLCEELDKANVF